MVNRTDMKDSFFQYLDYKRLIVDLIESKPHAGRGERKHLATSLGCQMAFITHVLNGEKDFSTEQILKVARHFNFNERETEYLVDLHAENRAGTSDLRGFYRRRLDSMRSQYESLKHRLDENQTLSLADQAQYYSNWLYAAVHMATTIKGLQEVGALADHFKLPEAELIPILEFLSNRKLINFKTGQVLPGIRHVYIDADSPLVQQHHAIWRAKTIHDLRSSRSEDMHYSLCFTISEKDWPVIREALVRTVKQCLKIIRPSSEEKLGHLSIDLEAI
jgi:uncharacterized protein (TIGR02147 family)